MGAAWDVLDSETVYSAPPWVEVRVETVELPDGQIVDDYHQVDLPPYVIVAATRPDDRFVLQRMYKHGLREETITLPAGRIEEGEAPLACAKRELLEETGYEADRWSRLGSFLVDASHGCGRAHFFRAEDAESVAEPDPGDLEEMENVILDRKEARAALEEDRIEVMSSALGLSLALSASPSLASGE